jgi:simple sugar transport system permease protein
MDKNRRALSALLVFVVMMLVFTIASPDVFLSAAIYEAVFTSLPIWIILASSLVFVIAAGEIDLSFVAIKTVATWTFAATAAAGWNPFLGMIFALAVGTGAGFLNGVIVTHLGLSSLVSTLGMGFLLQGLAIGVNEAKGTSLTFLKDTLIYNTFAGSLGGLPVQMLWGLFYAAIGVLLFNYHKFGARICCVGDNLESAREMGINTARVKTLAFVYVGLAAGLTGVLSALIYNRFWPTIIGKDTLMPILAAVFVGGTPTWGGVGTVVGAVIGAFTVRFINTGIIEAGLTGFWTELFNGLVIILALVGHKLNEPRYLKSV